MGTHLPVASESATGIAPAPTGECASRVVAEVNRRPHIPAHVIVFANEKGGVGKSTLAFQTAIALARRGADVLTIDLDARQRSLARALENREATIRSLDIDLPCPRYTVLQEQSGGMLCQEIQRLGAASNFVIIDIHGNDSPLARRAIAMANTLVTPLNGSFLDLDSIGRFSPGKLAFRQTGSFGTMVTELQNERLCVSGSKADWLLVQNRIRRAERRQQARIDSALKQLSGALDARIASGVSERVAYRELFLFGLTHPDLRDIPQLSHLLSRRTKEIDCLVEELRLPDMPGDAQQQRAGRVRARVRGREAYISALRDHTCRDAKGTAVTEPAG